MKINRAALVVVDIQNDFVTGSLAVPDAESVLPLIEELRQSPDYSLVVLTRDWHPECHCSFKEWPVHCVQNTPGAEFALLSPPKDSEIIVSKATEQNVESYSAFGADGALGAILANCDSVDVVGLATDFCVLATAIDAKKRFGLRTRVLLDCCRAVASEEAACEKLEEAGVEVVRRRDEAAQ